MQRNLNRLKNQTFDVLICGGGIYGAWTAYDAALLGLKVAIIDKGDWASGTSSASSKLIHGGLRYLETFDFTLVKKTLAEREMLLKAAPHRVWSLRFGIPVYESSRIGKLKLKIGLTLYDYLAGNLPAFQKHRRHSVTEFLEQFPFLSASSLTGGFSYLDAQTDDARFVLELIDGACSAGAVCINYCELTQLTKKNGIIDGAVLFDKTTNESIKLASTVVVDTTGRWSNKLLNENRDFRLSKGIHLVMPGILTDQALLLTAKADGRVFFMIPWYGRTLLGTTDTNYDGDIDNLAITSEDVRYLLTEANHVLATARWTEDDVIGKFAGVRVLPQSLLKNPSNISRDWSLQIMPNGLIRSLGGKFTSAREDAAVIVDKVCECLSIHRSCLTFGITLPWISDIDFNVLSNESMLEAKTLGIDDESAAWLIKRHGKRVGQIFQLCRENRELIERVTPELPFILADLVFCTRHEMVVHLDDLVRRRLPLTILAKLTVNDLTKIAAIAANILNWNSAKSTAEIEKCLLLYKAV
ncbi:MAG: glycerol-3-phosphate dehydrogenase/oxidase [Methylococcaceae bacterium]|nr:glycerol-3-phosphate dehydrogenase/oxidase [Methylococcaceae bacterium]